MELLYPILIVAAGVGAIALVGFIVIWGALLKS